MGARSSKTRPRLRKMEVAAWSSIFSSGLLLALSAAAYSYSQVHLSRAERIVSRFDNRTGAHPVYAEVQSEYQKQRRRAGALQSTALGLSIATAVALGTGLTLLQIDRKTKKKSRHHYARVFTAQGLRF